MVEMCVIGHLRNIAVRVDSRSARFKLTPFKHIFVVVRVVQTDLRAINAIVKQAVPNLASSGPFIAGTV